MISLASEQNSNRKNSEQQSPQFNIKMNFDNFVGQSEIPYNDQSKAGSKNYSAASISNLNKQAGFNMNGLMNNANFND